MTSFMCTAVRIGFTLTYINKFNLKVQYVRFLVVNILRLTKMINIMLKKIEISTS